MVAPLDPIKRHTCQKEGCAASYDELKALWRHMDREASHDFCMKCKYLAKDWDALVEHKIQSPTAHIACKFCGEDFKSASGRDRHIKMRHPVDQNLSCIGCGEHFNRAAALIQHLEFGHCPKISAAEFRSNLQHKHLIQKLLEHPDRANSALRDWDGRDIDSQSGGGVELASQSGGGVSLHESSLLDDDNIIADDSLIDLGNGGSLLPPIQPTVKSDIVDAVHDAQYPRLPSSPAGRSSTSKGSGKSKAPKPAPVHDRMSTLMANVSLSGGLQSGGATPPTASGATRVPMSDTSSVTTEKAPTQSIISSSAAESSKNVWGNSSKRLFPQAKATPVDTDWKAALKARDEAYQPQDSTNMFRASFWDPAHKDYDPDRFWNALQEKYVCPFPECEDVFDEPLLLQMHITEIHAVTQVRCPMCLNIFKSTYALVSHCEAGVSRCSIGRSSDFGKAVDTIAGGFLGVNEIWRPDVTAEEREDRPDENGKKVVGSGIRIAHNEFHTTMPPDFGTNEPAGAQVNRTWANNVSQGQDPAVPTSTSRKPVHDTIPAYEDDIARKPGFFNNYVAQAERRAGPAPAGQDSSWGKMSPANELLGRPAPENSLGVMARKDMPYVSRRGPEYEPSEGEYNE